MRYEAVCSRERQKKKLKLLCILYSGCAVQGKKEEKAFLTESLIIGGECLRQCWGFITGSKCVSPLRFRSPALFNA